MKSHLRKLPKKISKERYLVMIQAAKKIPVNLMNHLRSLRSLMNPRSLMSPMNPLRMSLLKVAQLLKSPSSRSS